MKSPRVSVICGYYNRANLVRRTLDGIRAQIFTDFEVLIFDDRSSDGTLAEIKRVLAEYGDSRFILIEHEKNLGFTRGLINAIKYAKGDYIAIHDSGDFSLPRRLTSQVKALDENPDVSVVGCHYVNFIEQSGIARVRRPNSTVADFESVCADSQFTHGEVMFRRSTYDLVGGYREQFKFSQDSDLWLRMIRQARFYTVPEVLYIRYVQFSGISYKPDTFVAQAGFYTIARVIAQADGFEAQRMLDKLATDSIFSVISVDDAKVQKVIVRGAVRGIVFGDSDQAKVVAEKFISNPLKKTGIKLLASLAHTRGGKMTLALLRKKLGMFATNEHDLIARANH